MKPILTLITKEAISGLASRSNLRYGKDMVKQGAVTITAQNTFNITAQVAAKGNKDSIVEIMSTTKGLRWKCTCSAKKNFFCEHCAAVGLFMNPEKTEK